MRRAVLALLIVTVAACATPEPDPSPGPHLLDGRAPEITTEVDVSAEGFDPRELALDTSQAFELVNQGDQPVRVVGDIGTDRRFDTGSLDPEERSVVAFNDPGRYTFTISEVETLPLEVVVTPAP